MKEYFRIYERNGIFQPQVGEEKRVSCFSSKTYIKWIPLSKRGSTWQETYEDALTVIKDYLEKNKIVEEKYHYIDCLV